MSAMDSLEREAQKTTRKRVHFTDLPDEDDESAGQMEKKARFPKGKKDKDTVKLDLKEMEEEEIGGGPIKATDPRLAAKERATRRQIAEAQKNLEEEDMGPAEEAFQGTVEEAAYFEPFNLKEERKEGYFDPEGNYVEYKVQGEIRDAWLDNVEVDTRYAERAAALGEDEEEQEQEPEVELSSADLAGFKRRIADTLLPQETVLQALRRLGGGSTGAKASNSSYRKAKDKDKDKDKDKNEKGAGKEQERMSAENKALFNQLTEDSVKLMDHGEYNVYSDKRETFLREAEGYEALQRARDQMLAQKPAGGAADDDDMFGDGDGGAGASPRTGGAPGVPGAPPAGESKRDSAGPGAEGGGAALGEGPGGQGKDGAPASVTGGGAMDEDSGYVLDPTTGYYFNSELGYYYDSSTGLFCSASTGVWYKFDEASGEYTEVAQDANHVTDNGATSETPAAES